MNSKVHMIRKGTLHQTLDDPSCCAWWQMNGANQVSSPMAPRPGMGYASKSMRIVTGVLADARKMTPSALPMMPFALSSTRRRVNPSSSGNNAAVPQYHVRRTLTLTFGFTTKFFT